MKTIPIDLQNADKTFQGTADLPLSHFQEFVFTASIDLDICTNVPFVHMVINQSGVIHWIQYLCFALPVLIINVHINGYNYQTVLYEFAHIKFKIFVRFVVVERRTPA